MSEFVWASPGGVYVVPEGFRHEFLSEFPGYRIRWSVKRNQWQLEQPCEQRNTLPTPFDDRWNDDVIRKQDGFWKVMEFGPGERFGCTGVVTPYPLQRCNWTLYAPINAGGEVTCPICRKAGRDGRNMASHWRFSSALIEHLRYTDPLRGGTRRMTRDLDARNAARVREAQRRTSDAVTSMDAVDYRWISGIDSTGYGGKTARRTISDKDLS